MDLRAKQRLTGAVILVALVVLLVPELLTGPGDAPPAAEVAGDEGLREYTIDIDGQNPPGSATTTAPAQDAAVNLPAPQAPAAADTSRAVPGESAAPALPAPAPAPAQPAPVAAPATNPMAAAPVAAAPAASNQRAERGTFVVQLGTFGSRDNADRLARDMKAKGFSAFVVPIATNGRELFRVRVGPTRDRAAAESLAAELKRAGQSGSIVPIS